MQRLKYFLKVVRYVLSADFREVSRNPYFRFKYGQYTRHNGDKVPFFFQAESFPLSKTHISGNPVERSVQARRVLEIMENRTSENMDTLIYGREVARVKKLIDARRSGEDAFVLLLTRPSGGTFDIDDGATRASILVLDGETHARAVVAPWT